MTKKTDVWGLGCLMYLVFEERLPLEDLTREEIQTFMKKRIGLDLKFSSETPSTIKDAILKCV